MSIIATLRQDALAGLTSAAVVLPVAMAYATIAGLPVAVGLYTAFLPMVIYALMGSSRVLSVSTTSTLAILTGIQIAHVTQQADAQQIVTMLATLTLLVGGMLVLASMLGLGFAANFISLPVLVGFKAGVGAVIMLGQVPKLLGLHLQKEGFFSDILSIFQALPDCSGLTVAISLVTLTLLFLVERYVPRAPAPLIAVMGSIIVSGVLGLNELGIATVGNIPHGLPVPTWPDFSLIQSLLPVAGGIALMSFTESIAAARAFAAPDQPGISPNRELLALGAANLAGAMFGAMPAAGGTSQTAVASAAGAKSQKYSLVTALAAMAIMMFFAPMLGLLPNATLAALVFFYSSRLINPREFIAIFRVRTLEFRWACVATLGVIEMGTLQGIAIAILISLLALASQTVRPRLYVMARKPGTNVMRPVSAEHPADETFENLLILHPEGRVFFLNAAIIAERINKLLLEYRPHVLLVDMSSVHDIEYSALQMLINGERKWEKQGVTLWMSGLTPGVLDAVRRSGLADKLGQERLMFSTEMAIRHYLTGKSHAV